MGYRKKWSDGEFEVWDDEFEADVREDACFYIVLTGLPYNFGSTFRFTDREKRAAKEYREDFLKEWPNLANLSYSDPYPKERDDILEWFYSNWYEDEEWDDDYDDGEIYESGIPFDIHLSDFVDIGACHGPAYSH